MFKAKQVGKNVTSSSRGRQNFQDINFPIKFVKVGVEKIGSVGGYSTDIFFFA
jgi:hypothetical protein